jgi:hypothetical protein
VGNATADKHDALGDHERADDAAGDADQHPGCQGMAHERKLECF